MKFPKISLALLLAMALGSIYGQTFPAIGAYSDDELGLKACSFDKDAEAVVLLDQAFSYYDDEWQLITDRRIRIKILNDKGLDRGNIAIHFYSGDKFEFIRNIKGQTYTNGQVSALSSKSVYTEKINEWWSAMKFAMPNVKPGSILEYEYESVMKSYGGLDRWIFQKDIPTLKSSFLLQIIPNHEFSYVVTKKSNYPIVIQPKSDLGQIYFEMENVPGLKFEPFMDAIKDYRQQVEFQLSGYYNRAGGKQDYNATWKALAYDLSTDANLGGTIKKDLPKDLQLTMAVEAQATAAGKLNAIYKFVAGNFAWNGMDSRSASEGIKKVWDKKSGTSGEINLVLVNLLREYGLTASPLLVAERDFGKVDPKLPFVDRFNKTVAWAQADGKTFILDATQKYCPADLVPFPLLNTNALIIDKNTTNVITIGSNNATYHSEISLAASLDKAGLLAGMAKSRTTHYARQQQLEKIKGDKQKFLKEFFEEKNANLVVDSFAYRNDDNDSLPLEQAIQFHSQFDESGDFVLLNYNLFTGFSKNPFQKEERFTNVDFGYPFDEFVEEMINIPADCKIEELPANKRLLAPDRDISIERIITRSGNTLNIRLHFVQTCTLIRNDDYPYLREFYKEMIDMLNEPITIKMPK